jgi:hypothetical protein
MNNDKLTQRAIKIVHGNGRIILKSGDSYIHQNTNIAAGALGIVYTYQSRLAMVFADLSVAHYIAKLLGARVVISYPKKKTTAKELLESTGMEEAICNLINRKLDQIEADDKAAAEKEERIKKINKPYKDGTIANSYYFHCENKNLGCYPTWCGCHCVKCVIRK